MKEMENARKKQEKLAGKKEETKVSKRMLRVGEPRRESGRLEGLQPVIYLPERLINAIL